MLGILYNEQKVFYVEREISKTEIIGNMSIDKNAFFKEWIVHIMYL